MAWYLTKQQIDESAEERNSFIFGLLSEKLTACPNRTAKETFNCKTVLPFEIRLYNLKKWQKIIEIR